MATSTTLRSRQPVALASTSRQADLESHSPRASSSFDSSRASIDSTMPLNPDEATTTGERKSPTAQIESFSGGQHELRDEFPDVDEKKLLWKIDIQLIPWLSFLYLLSFLDRSAIGNAAIYGLAKDIGASDWQYRFALTLFFIPYALLEVPSNVLLKKLRPSIWIPAMLVAWGVCMASQGIVQNPKGLYIARFFLGLTECGLFPGVNYYLSCWYKRSEFGLRSAVFFSAATAAGAFGGLLAAALAQIKVGQYRDEGWRWIFIVEGIATVVAGVAALWLCHDFPDTAKFLTSRERDFVIRRLQADGQFSAAGEKFQWKRFRAAMWDVKTWLGMMVYAGCNGPLYCFSLFTPTIVQNLGYRNPTTANLISAPIYVWACILTVGVGFCADRTGGRGFYNLVFFAIGGLGYILLLVSRNFGLSYFAVYLAASGIYPLVPNTIAWVSGNSEGTYKRAIVMGWVISFGNLNGAVTSQIYRAEDKPWYRLGHGLALMYIALGFILSALLLGYLYRENKLRDEGRCNEVIGGDPTSKGHLDSEGRAHGGWFRTLEDAKIEKGDQWSGFRYRL